MKNCPQCGAPIKDTAKFCMKCGCNLAQYEAAHAGGIFCPECGARLEEGALFCPECGFRLDDAPATEAEQAGGLDLSDLSDIESGIDALVEKQEAEEAEYGRKLKEALALLRREKYKEAEAVYNGLLDENPDDMNGYIGLIRVASENYTRLFGKEIDEAIRLAKKVSGKEDPDAFDEDFAAYIGRRAEETRRLAEEEAKKKAAAEAERRKEEEKRRRAEYFASRFAVEKGVLKKYKGQEARTELPRRDHRDRGRGVFRMHFAGKRDLRPAGERHRRRRLFRVHSPQKRSASPKLQAGARRFPQEGDGRKERAFRQAVFVDP